MRTSNIKCEDKPCKGKNTIRDRGGTALYAAYTVDIYIVDLVYIVDMVYTVDMAYTIVDID